MFIKENQNKSSKSFLRNPSSLKLPLARVVMYLIGSEYLYIPTWPQYIFLFPGVDSADGRFDATEARQSTLLQRSCGRRVPTVRRGRESGPNQTRPDLSHPGGQILPAVRRASRIHPRQGNSRAPLSGRHVSFEPDDLEKASHRKQCFDLKFICSHCHLIYNHPSYQNSLSKNNVKQIGSFLPHGVHLNATPLGSGSQYVI